MYKSDSEVIVVLVRSSTGVLLTAMADNPGSTHVSPGLNGGKSSSVGSSACYCCVDVVSFFSVQGGISIGLGFMLVK